jgi:hypothetical protein
MRAIVPKTQPRPFLLLLALTIAACSGHRDGAELMEQAGGRERLRAAALEVQKFAKSDTEQTVPEAAWPEAFRVLAPEFVTVDSEGAWVTMDFDPIDASGLYIVFDADTRPENLGPDLTFEALAPGIYSYYMIVGG